MLKIIYLKRFLIVSMLMLLTACDSKLTQKEIAVDKIASYADNGIPPVPTVLDYSNAGVYSVTDKNLNDINFKITRLVYADVDTTIEIQHVVNSIVIVENHIQPPKKDKIVQKEESKVSNKPILVKETPKETDQDNEKKEEIVSPTKEEDTKIPNKPLLLEHVPKTTTNDSVTIQIFGEVGSSVLINTKKVDTIPADGKLVLKLNTSGDSEIKHFNIVLKDKAGNKSEVLVVSIQKVEMLEDTTKPIITLQGANPQTIELGTSYTELGATTNDGSEVTIDSTNVNTNLVGTYTVTYTAKDAQGNQADTVARSVKVEDTTKPIITLLGSNLQILELGSDYIELGATTNDGSAVKIDTTEVDTTKVGTYTVTYTATDAQGNQADKVTRTVKVEDTTKPIITLQGANPQIIELGSEYIELGATTNDGSAVKIDATAVDTTKVGTYTVTYTAKDDQGNQADTVTRTVKVETSKPILKSKKSTLYSNNTISVQIDNVPELGIARPWMGIYEVGEPSTFKHMVYYQFLDKAVDGRLYLTEYNPESEEALSRYEKMKEGTQYELRKVALVKGKYVTYTSEEITVQPIHAQQVNYRFVSDVNAIPSRDSDTHSGEYSLKINKKEKDGYSEWKGDNIPINNAKVLTFSGWSKSENVSSTALYALDFRVTFNDGSYKWYYADTKFDTGTHGWQEVTITTQFDKPVVSVRPYAILNEGTGTVWFDDISVNEGNEISEDIKNAYYTNTTSVEIDEDSEPNSLRPWVGIYEVGEPSTFEHMVYYQFTDSVTTDEGQLNLTEVRPESKEALSRYKNIQKDTQYELRMVALIDGEYITYATKEITVQPSKYRDEIHKSFDEYYEEYKSSIPKALTKDENGTSDTYVLYDLQTYMQSAIIYADENDDIEIIEKLLELVKIPFEEQYMTDGKWLNNKYQVGKEMVLPISQYFSLLTRVFSVAQRHGIDVTLTQKEQNIIMEHIDRWINETTVKWTGGIADTHLFFNQSAMLFYDYARHKGITIPNIEVWKKYVQGYKRLTFDKFTEKDTCVSKPSEQNCIVLSRLEMKDSYRSYQYSGYGAETTRDDMFGEDGMAKLQPKALDTISTDVSHGRRFNWYFETVKRFGVPFGINVSDDILQGWANNLAYRVSRGTSKNPYFTNFSDGQDGWYRVNYDGGTGIPRKFFGYAPGDMDIHFVSGSYGMFGVYNPKIYNWIENWVKNHPKFMGTNYYSGRILDYYTSMSVNIKNGLLK